MPVLPKFQLKLLFESGDLITQTTLYDLIDATYNPTLVAGSNVSINSVITPSGTTLTINSASSLAQLTTVGTSGAATLVGNVLNIPIYSSGDIYSLAAGPKAGISVPLNLNAAVGSDTSVKLTEGTNITLTQTSATEIKIDAVGGGVTSVSGTLPIVSSGGTTPAISINTMTAATAGAGGLKGAVPASLAGDQTKFLRADGTWVIPTTGGGTVTSLTTTGTGVSTLLAGVLNIPTPVIPAVPFTSLTTTGTGVSTLLAGVLNIPTPVIPFTSLTTTGTGASTLAAGVLNIPTPVIPAVPFTSLTTIGTSGVSTLASGVLNVPDYTISYTNATPTPQPFPGNAPFDNIPTNSTFSNQTFTQMMNQMLYPELFPTLSFNPATAGTFTLAQQGLQEAGDIIVLNFNSTFNRGTISPAYGTNGFRSGLPTGYDYIGTGLPATVVSTSLSNSQSVGDGTTTYQVLAGNQSWQGRVAYSAGQQPLSSTGNPFNSALPLGNTNYKTRTINGVYPVFATSDVGNPTVLTKQSLQTMTTTIVIDFAAETLTDKNTLEVPAVWSTLIQAQVFNTTFGTWNNLGSGMNNFLPSTNFNKTVNGASIPYIRFENSTGTTSVAQKLRFQT